MIDPTQQQWLDNEEILERFVLNRLSPDEERRLSELRRHHPELENAIALQARVIAGIRVLGRRELRARLARELTEKQKGNRIVWTPALFLKVAAALVILAGTAWWVATFTQPEPDLTPVAESQKKIKQPLKADSAMKKKSEEIEQPVSVPKKGIRQKPTRLSAPAATTISKQRNKLNAQSMAMLRPNEVSATLYTATGDTIPTRVFFKNPSDLSAVNIKVPVEDRDGQLESFYVHYEKDQLSVYLDNSRYLSRFQNALLTDNTTELLITADTLAYRVDLKSAERFKRAVRRPK